MGSGFDQSEFLAELPSLTGKIHVQAQFILCKLPHTFFKTPQTTGILSTHHDT